MKVKPVTSPHLVNGKLSAAAARGKQLYFGHATLDCRKCHPAPLYTDLKSHNAGVEDRFDNNVNWDTPSIIECWRTAPYDHLGSTTIRDRLTYSKHSNASQILTQDELSDLLEFVLSL
jgi:hypothetical protein